MIVIVSKDKDFSHTLAEQVVRELEMPCECVDTIEEIKKNPSLAPSLVIAAEPQRAKDGEVMVIKTPARIVDVLANIRACLKKTGYDTIEFGVCVLSVRQKLFSHKPSGKSAELTDKETQLLRALARDDKKGIAKEALLKGIWGFEEGLNTHTLETHIYRLRAKMKEVSGNEMIEAVEGGYRLV